MGRVAGYYLKLNDILNKRELYPTKRTAVMEAKEWLQKTNTKTVGIVRANDKVLLMTISINKDKEFVQDIK